MPVCCLAKKIQCTLHVLVVVVAAAASACMPCVFVLLSFDSSM